MVDTSQEMGSNLSGEHAARRRHLRERLQQGAALAETLTGLGRSDAVERITSAGFYAEVIEPDMEWLTLDLYFERVRIFVDDEGLVTQAEAG